MFICSVIVRQLDLYLWLGDHYYFVENFRCYLKFYECENFSDLFIFPLYFRIRKGYFPFPANNSTKPGKKKCENMNQASENCRDIVIMYRFKCLEQTSWKPFVFPDLGSIKHKTLAYFRSKQSTLNLHSIPDQKGYFCKRREIWRETHAPMWLLIGRVIFLTREKSSFAFLIGRIIFFSRVKNIFGFSDWLERICWWKFTT